ncbi:putative phosphoribosylformylglycinamidine synthase [Prevotella sp. DNF00663]|uniref:phosphoribosylformylglycinamidine synthase n=1 Tax=Prevotella sp. DNF00663 TaxID=1384078 RepID=UPI000780381F|nr:phosphoribosylformylglycinamidine synthase [Prevotella sp. DNF00663]KXB80631.1 putative phosphoribosylformylglycinamidine synthase [Prevotella sp. DNF00663]
MILFFRTPSKSVIATEIDHQPSQGEVDALCWLYGDASLVETQHLDGFFVGPRREMITPWSTNAVEITQNMSLNGISRIEEYFPVDTEEAEHDPMLQRMYKGIGQDVFTVSHQPEPIKRVEDLEAFNESEGLALSKEEMEYLHTIEKQNGRPLTDSEIFGFAQINSEHCRHKIFGGTFIIDGKEMESSLFAMIKKTTQENPNKILSAYKDNVAFSQGPTIEQFAPADQSTSDYFRVSDIESVISLKAETHNFPTTVEPFNGAATGTGGEIRDRMGGGTGSWPIAGTAVYMTAYPRLKDDNGQAEVQRDWEDILPVRQWLYQTPEQILIKASNGASDFGNKFGQPLITGSLLTFEHQENNEKYAYDKVIMLAGGVGYGKKRDCLKREPQPGNKVVVVGGDNYRIGLGGGSVSSVDTGRYSNGIELNAVQRANPEMQKRAYNLVRALVEEDTNPVVSIHDHGSAGHLNCLSELVEECGGEIDMTKLPIGDKTLSAKEIIANESQERMGLLIDEAHLEHVQNIAERERAPMYVVGETTGDAHFSFKQGDGVKPFDLDVAQMFGHSPKTIMKDSTKERHYSNVEYDKADHIDDYLNRVLQLEAVACKDWLTNKVDRSVTGKIARQQCQGQIQLPLSDCGVVALDYRGQKGIATALGHAPQAGLANPEAGSILAVAESLTNIVWAPLADGMDSLSLSANWMWPCRSQEGEDARLYSAVKALSNFCCELHINVPTGKDSLSLTQQYPNGEKIISPGTVIVSSGGEVSDIRKVVSPVLVNDKNSSLYHVDFSFDEQRLGGSAFAQSLNKIGDDVPTVKNAEYFTDCFNAIQELIRRGWIMAGHDISAGGLITTLLEMTFANTHGGMRINLYNLGGDDVVKNLFAENPGVVIQVSDEHKADFMAFMDDMGVAFAKIGYPTPNERTLVVKKNEWEHTFDIDALRDTWYKTSYLLDRKQSMNGMAKKRYTNYKKQPVEVRFPANFQGTLAQYGLNADRRKPSGIKAAIIREKGTNGEREMAYSMYLAGFDVKDVMMTDLISGRETLEDINLIVFCGGFSNSDVLGSAKGWAGAFLYNPKAKEALDKFYARKDTLSLGICNGCQLMVELNLINPEHEHRSHLCHNTSKKFESSFLGLTIPQNESVMFGSLSGSKLGLWVAHGEGRFYLPEPEDHYNIIAKYNYAEYPGNPNGSDYNVAGICSNDGRHLAMMPHLERAIFPWQNAWYPEDRKNDEVTPWIEAFVNARKWIEQA